MIQLDNVSVDDLKKLSEHGGLIECKGFDMTITEGQVEVHVGEIKITVFAPEKD